MKRTPSQPGILCLFILIVLFSCSTNQFSIRKNFQPRVKIEESIVRSETMPSKISSIPIKDSVQAKEQTLKEEPAITNLKPNQTIIEKMVRKPSPEKEKTNGVIVKKKRDIKKTKGTNLDGTQVPGLVIGLIALTLAIAAFCMVIAMVNGALVVGFVTGLILAIVALVLGIVGKFFPFRGLSTTAVVLAAIAIFVLCIFLGLVLAGLI